MRKMQGNRNKAFGTKSEERAVAFLQSEGFVIVERNFFAKKIGEIDIIAFKEGVIHFIEVKASQTEFDPIYNITPAKVARLIKASHYFLQTRGVDSAYVLDALLIRGGRCELIENITL